MRHEAVFSALTAVRISQREQFPEPAGSKVCDWQTAQASGAEADQTVFYKSDFIGSSAKIAPNSIDRIARTARSGLAANQPSIIEPSGDEALDAARVSAVSLQLASYGITQPSVTVAIPAALGMQGIRAEQIAEGVGNFGNGSNGTAGRGYQPMGMGGSFGNNYPRGNLLMNTRSDLLKNG